MSGVDECFNNVCPICERLVKAWSLREDGQHLGCYNIDEELIKVYGLLNSSILNSETREVFFKRFNTISCLNCSYTIRDARHIETVKQILKRWLDSRNERHR